MWATEGFAVAEAEDPRQPGRFAGLVAGAMAPPAQGNTLLVAPATADAQIRAEQAHVGVADGDTGSSTDDATIIQ